MNAIVLVGVLLVLAYPADSSLLDPVIENVRHIKATHEPGKIEGMWKKKMLWKPRWIKEWKSSNVLKPIWRKFWGPVIIREWVPIPKPPPQWDSHSRPIESGPISPGSPFTDSPEPPAPNFSYLQTPMFPPKSHSYHQPKQPTLKYNTQGGILNSGNYHGPPLPITSGFKSQAESYAGQSSYASSADSSSFDLNPPVEQYTPQQPDYGYNRPFGNVIYDASPAAPKPAGFSSHAHHHHHHHHTKYAPHIHTPHAQNSDQTKFPPDWNSWNPHLHSQVQQGSAPVSAVSSTKSIPPDTGKHATAQSPLPFQTGDNDFIQQSTLLSEYHYTEPAPENPTRTTTLSPPSPITSVRPVSTSPAIQTPVLHSNPSSSSSHQHNPPPFVWQAPTPAPAYARPAPAPQQRPQPTHHSKTVSNPEHGPLPFHPRHPSPVIHKLQPSKQNKPNFSSSKGANEIKHPGPKMHFPKEHKPHLNKTSKPVRFELQKVPDFKALPSSVETFHFIEPFPSNQTLTRAALVGNINQSESDKISIISPEKVPAHIAKLAEEVVQKHLKLGQKENDSLQSTTVEPASSTQETRVTVVLPTSSSHISKTLKAYLADESTPENKANVFIVTPVPLEKGEFER